MAQGPEAGPPAGTTGQSDQLRIKLTRKCELKVLEEQTRDGRAWGRPREGFVASFIKSKGRRLLDWEPDGAVLAELPSGRQVRFGRAGVEPEALLKLHNYRVIARSLGRGSIGFAESYVDGDIDCSDLTG